MRIIEALEKRAKRKTSDVIKIELSLYKLAFTLEKSARMHLKRVTSILQEFDLHDESHSEKVIQNIEQLLGKKTIESLSSYELFLIHLSSFFHDCAMAPSDWEINLLEITEGNELFATNTNSIRHDLKPPFKTSQAISFVSDRKSEIYKDFNGDVAKWLFSPSSENELQQYLSALLIEYQTFRNGYAEQIRSLKQLEDFETLNQSIRIDFIRSTHHIRVEQYIRNLETEFCNAFEQPAWGKKLAHDLSLICRAHGENISFISELETKAQYFGNDSANLQLISILLRLGDIIHFSFDRAPIDLRSSKLFKSEYSFQQWAIKNSGVNYTIFDGLISFRAYCDRAEIYFKLNDYIDLIENEIQIFFRFEHQWKKKYIPNLQYKVDREGITNNNESFQPQRGLCFTLDQKRIIELLMGVGLYKDKYACIRELYQNSLDACRCMLSQLNEIEREGKGFIEFRLEKVEDDIFLCCIDNGIGMSKDTIENYLLKIGNSFYKSPAFFRQQAAWGGSFTPISQFGIGILSCFMIGDKIEITTRTNNGDYISCSIDGPHEYFYYKKTSEFDKEKIISCGTIVKILLNDQTKNELHSTKIEKLGLLFLRYDPSAIKKFPEYEKYYKNYENHLYQKVNNIIGICPTNVEIRILQDNNQYLEIESKPIVLDGLKFGIEINDFDFINYLNNNNRFTKQKYEYKDLINYIKVYEINIVIKSMQYKTMLLLPKKGFDKLEEGYHNSIPITEMKTCIDGIEIRNNSNYHEHYFTSSLIYTGLINYFGEIRPQISIDRTSMITFPEECEEHAKMVTSALIKEVINKTNSHIQEYNILQDSHEFDLIWNYIFEKFRFANQLFINDFSNTEYGDILWCKLEILTGKKTTIKEFVAEKEIKLFNYNLKHVDELTKELILAKLMSSNKIEISDDCLMISSEDSLKLEIIEAKRNIHDEPCFVISADIWNVKYNEFDIISNFYPIIPQRLFDLIRFEKKIINSKTMQINVYENGISAFFGQDPLLINELLGMFQKSKNAFGEYKSKNDIYNFEEKRATFGLFEIGKNSAKNSKKEVYVLYVFISPKTLSEDETLELKNIEKEKSYVKGVKEGWSILVTGMDQNNVVIKAGKLKREEIVAEIPETFWNKYNDYTFKFTDDTIMKKV